MNEANFLYAAKHQSFLQVEAIIFGGPSQVCPKYPKQQVYNIFVRSQEKK